MTAQTQSQGAILNYLAANPGAHHNSEIAEATGYSITGISNSACRLFEQRLIRRIGKGVWQGLEQPQDPPQDPAPVLSTQTGNPATVAAMDLVQEDKRSWIEIKVRRATRAPGGYDYHSISTRDGRTGIIVWDA
jgi:hypothetical protein